MSKEVSIVKQSYDLIRKDLGLEEEWSFKDSENDFDRLEVFLTAQIRYLLDNDFNKLINALYRIDTREEEVTHLLNEAADLANSLAKVVIEREKQKIFTRSTYRS